MDILFSKSLKILLKSLFRIAAHKLKEKMVKGSSRDGWETISSYLNANKNQPQQTSKKGLLGRLLGAINNVKDRAVPVGVNEIFSGDILYQSTHALNAC